MEFQQGEYAMPYKQLFFRAEAREKIVRGAAALADAVRVTLGPKSKCVLIGKKWGRPIVCNDGVTIAKEIEMKDGEENSPRIMTPRSVNSWVKRWKKSVPKEPRRWKKPKGWRR